MEIGRSSAGRDPGREGARIINVIVHRARPPVSPFPDVEQAPLSCP